MQTSTRQALGAYRRVDTQTRVAAASPHRLIGLLFEGGLSALAQAKASLNNGDIAGKGEAIGKAISILQEGLIGGLNPEAGGELAANLNDLYAYMTQRLLVANLTNDIAALDEVSGLLRDLQQAWEAIAEHPSAKIKA